MKVTASADDHSPRRRGRRGWHRNDKADDSWVAKIGGPSKHKRLGVGQQFCSGLPYVCFRPIADTSVSLQTRAMWPLIALLAVQAPNAPAPGLPVVSIQGQPVYADQSHNISVEYFELPQGVSVFTSRLPAGWSFGVTVDGNQDGVWGSGSGMPPNSMMTSPDRKFGQDSRNGVFCSQYVFTSVEGDPAQIYSSSECGELPSNSRVIMSGFDSSMRATLTYEIPSVEFFGPAQTARIQVCVWDTARWTCQHKLPNLLELKRLPAATAKAQAR